MAQTLLQSISALLGMGGTSVKVADCAMSSTTLTSVYGNGGAAAFADLGDAVRLSGAWKIRFKNLGGFTAAAQLGLVVATDTAFTASRQLVAVIQAVSCAAGITVPASESFCGVFDTDPTPFRYARWENVGTALGASAITFDWEVLAFPI